MNARLKIFMLQCCGRRYEVIHCKAQLSPIFAHIVLSLDIRDDVVVQFLSETAVILMYNELNLALGAST